MTKSACLCANSTAWKLKLAQHEEELNRKNSELLQSNKLAAIGTLAAGVAHELNNPLNNIYLSVQVLKRIIGGPECPASVREIVGDITTQTARVKHIVGELLEFARGRAPEIRKIELRNLLSRAFRAVGNTISVDNIIFSVNSDRDDLIIEADPDQMEQVFINLFHNAVEAMDGAGTLEAAIESKGDVINICVSDTGKGIPPDAVAKLFRTFFYDKGQGHRSRPRHHIQHNPKTWRRNPRCERTRKGVCISYRAAEGERSSCRLRS